MTMPQPIGFNIIQPTINFGIIGCVSSGKSTLLNSLFCDTYSDMKIKRTTMIPQVYLCDPKIKKDKDYAKLIRANNEKINKKIIEHTEAKKALTIQECYEQVYNVSPIENFIKLPPNTNVAIFDIPGLNDSQTKKVYFQYLQNNFYKFDYVLFVVDIQSALNTSDEMDILELIIENIENIKEKYKKDIKLLVICNKCDGMELNTKTNELKMDEPELEEMYEQIVKTLKNEIPATIKYDIIKYSAEDTYVYRLLSVGHSLDDKYIDRLGNNELGKIQWKKLNKEITNKQDLIKILKKEINTQERLKNTGYEGLIEKINKSTSQITDFLISKVDIIEDKIIKQEKDLSKVSNLFDNMYFYIKEIKIINKDIDTNKIISNITNFWHSLLSSAFPFTSIISTNHNTIKTNYYETLMKQKVKYPEVKFDSFINNYINKETEYFVTNLDTLITTSYTLENVINTLTSIFKNEGKLPIEKIITCIYKIPVDDIHKIISKLPDYNISYPESSKIYMNYHKNYRGYVIDTGISKIKVHALANMYMKEYISTDNMNYNLLNIIVKSTIHFDMQYDVRDHTYLVENLEREVDSFLEPFKLFIQFINRGTFFEERKKII
jgi:predicted GTPase